jgi:hypothetical protein
MTGKYISYHAFNWAIARRRFVKSILAAGGSVEAKKKENKKHLVKVSNPLPNMHQHKNWYSSNKLFWASSFSKF